MDNTFFRRFAVLIVDYFCLVLFFLLFRHRTVEITLRELGLSALCFLRVVTKWLVVLSFSFRQQLLPMTQNVFKRKSWTLVTSSFFGSDILDPHPFPDILSFRFVPRMLARNN